MPLLVSYYVGDVADYATDSSEVDDYANDGLQVDVSDTATAEDLMDSEAEAEPAQPVEATVVAPPVLAHAGSAISPLDVDRHLGACQRISENTCRQ